MARRTRAELEADLALLRGHTDELERSLDALIGGAGGASVAVDHVTDSAMAWLDPEGIVVGCDAGVEKVNGHLADQVMGRSAAVFYPPEDAAAGIPQRHLSAAVEHRRVSVVGWLARRDGSRYWASIVITALQGGDGRLSGFVMMTRDLSDFDELRRRLREAGDLAAERKMIDGVLEASERRHRELLTAIQEGLWALDKEGRSTYVNRSLCAMLGYDEPEMIGRHVSSFVDEVDREEMSYHLEKWMRGSDELFEFEFPRRDGSRLLARLNAGPVYDSDGNHIGSIAGVEDITKRRQAEIALQESEEKYRGLVDSTPDYILGLDVEGRVTAVNQALRHGLRLPEEHIIGRRFADVGVPSNRVEEWAAREREALSNGHTVDFVCALITAGGSPRTFETSLTPIHDNAGNVVGLRGISRDITATQEADEALRQQARTLEVLMAATSESVLLFDDEGRFRYANPAALVAIKRPADALLGKTWREVGLSADVLESFDERLEAAIAADEQRWGELRYADEDGEHVFSYVINPTHGCEGEVDGAAVSGQEMTVQLRAERALRASEDRYRALFEQIPEAVFVFDAERRAIECNRQMARLAGTQCESLVGQLPEESWAPKEVVLAQEKALLGETVQWEAIHHTQRTDRDVYLSGAVAPLKDADGQVIGGVSVVSDITDRKRADALVEHLSLHDPLTDLANRALFHDRLRQALDNSRRDKSKVAVAIVNMDGFKSVNDALGHTAADRLLQAVAARLRGIMRGGDTLARTGGDEIALIMPTVRDIGDSIAVADKIMRAFRLPWSVGEASVRATASVGFAHFPDDAEEPQTLIESADNAMRRAKELGRNCYQFFDPSVSSRASERQQLIGELRRALTDKQFVVHYQPQIDLQDGRIVGLEALVRWQHPTRGLVPPGEFIPLAEEAGLIGPIGEWVTRTACRQAAAWQPSYGAMRMAVNMSPRALRGPAMVFDVRDALEDTGLQPGMLEIELTETAIMADAEVTARHTSQLHDLGVTLALDDFGTGFSSLSHLRLLPIDRVKIDRSFIANAEHDENAQAIVRTVTYLGAMMHLPIVAEGVETEEQLRFLQGLGCQEAQGFLFARPMPPTQCEEFLGNGGSLRSLVDPQTRSRRRSSKVA